MNDMSCPVCGGGGLELRRTKKETNFEGVALVIDDAEILVCSKCGEESYTAKELRRWQKLKQERLAQIRQAAQPADVKAIREKYGLSVSEFASLLGVTRQAVYGWEDPAKEGIKFGPAALLVEMLNGNDELSTLVFSRLRTRATERGQFSAESHQSDVILASPEPPHCNRSGLLPRLAGGEFFTCADEVAA